jgi:hypothetical protein
MPNQTQKAEEHGTFPTKHPPVVSHDEWSKAPPCHVGEGKDPDEGA